MSLTSTRPVSNPVEFAVATADTTPPLLSVRVGTETYDRLQINANGVYSGDGTATPVLRAGLASTFTSVDATVVGIGTTTRTAATGLNLVSGTTAASGIAFGTDTDLFRSAANTLKTDDTFIATGIYSEGSNAGSVGFVSYVVGDGQNRYVVGADGKITWGSGALAGDTNLYRSAANRLKTDDDLYVAGTLLVQEGGSYQHQIGPLSGLGGGTYPGIIFGSSADTILYRKAADTLQTDDALIVTGTLTSNGALQHANANLGFYGTSAIAKQTGVAVTAGGIHAALVALGLFAA